MNNLSKYNQVCSLLEKEPKTWLITGVAGFIGSNLLEALLKLNQNIIGLDNFSTGYKHNLEDVQTKVTTLQWSRFKFIEGDICNLKTCEVAVKNVDYVLHQAALGSVPRSIKDPIRTNFSNISGFLNMLHTSKESNVASFTYAASSSTYGDHPTLPKVENTIGKPLSPYAVTKYVNELYAGVYSSTYGFKSIGLRYFNVFGRRQDPNGAYAAVIPKWTSSIRCGKNVYINGDGKNSRDFCYIDNVIQINILSATANEKVKDEIYNVAVGERTSLNQLYKIIRDELNINTEKNPIFRDFREGDVRHSQANINKAIMNLGYQPKVNIEEGLKRYIQDFKNL